MLGTINYFTDCFYLWHVGYCWQEDCVSTLNAGLKVDASQYWLWLWCHYENVHLCKRHTVVCRVFCFWQFASLFLGLATHYRESWYIMCTKWCLQMHKVAFFWITGFLLLLKCTVSYFCNTCVTVVKLNWYFKIKSK